MQMLEYLHENLSAIGWNNLEEKETHTYLDEVPTSGVENLKIIESRTL